ncbi:class I SAM-dependent methyltransferase [Eubacterium sp.]|uniref:class I SAM-dependent methyltransferase n=1 Tax=Eubacterium sp. TaxID=142586 RepID=UPI003EFD29CB
MIDTNSIKNQFNSDAKNYDSKRKIFIPCFDDFYISSTRFIAKTIKQPNWILDLGAGTGLLTSFWYREFPNSNYVLDDISLEMLDMAKKRFNDALNVDYVTDNYNEALPKGNFDAVISALSIHHLDDSEKQRLFNRIYDRLQDGGIFVNYDMFNADTVEMTEQYNRYWESIVLSSDLPNADIEHWKRGRAIDKECSIIDEINMLKNAGFKNVNCIYSNVKFGVVAAIK